MPARLDRLTLIAIAIVVYAGANVTHEIIGHCGAIVALGGKCSFISTTDIRIVPDMPPWKFRIDAFAGSAANWLAAVMWFGLLRAMRWRSPALRYFLWLSVCVNLFIPSTYLLISPLIRFGDWYNMTDGLPRPFLWTLAMTASGAVACWAAFRLCRAELRTLIGTGGSAGKSNVWALVVPAYLAGGSTVVASALFSPLPPQWALLVSAGGTFGLTSWLLALPIQIPGPPNGSQGAFVVVRSTGWIVGAALCALIFIGVLGPGLSL